MNDLKAPFWWWGGKRRVARVSWRAFGPDVPNYVEPFAGSLAVLLGRPGGPGKIETVNDRDRYIANFWRAVTADPDQVAAWCDWPVNEADLHARHQWLVEQLPRLRERMHVDPDFYDVKIAGWWVWGICQWIGGGWCVEPHRKRPNMSGDTPGRGVHRKVHDRRRPQMTSAGQGVHLPSLGNDRGIHSPTSSPCRGWFRRLQERLRRVRVACGDWERVLGPSVLGKGKNVGGRRPCAVFLDPPYLPELRATGLYAEDDADVSRLAREWAAEHGDDPDLRIALCGYEGEHDMPDGWRIYAWRAGRGYAGEQNENRSRERIWFSPHCLPFDEPQQRLFDVVRFDEAQAGGER